MHTCKIDGCTNKIAAGKNYCYIHSQTASSGLTYTPEVAEDVLDFSNIEISHNSSYTVCTGTIKNNGRRTYTFVEVKGKFKNASGTVLDTDWTYAVGSDGLAPGESTTFRLSVKKDTAITKCTIEILDYDKE
ncbi:MAG: FxLYD domain-containing protein [Ruminiclostridium sp.]